MQNPSAAEVGFGVSIAGKLSDGKQRENDAADVECRKLAVVNNRRPAELAVKLAESGKIARAEGDHHIRQGCAHGLSIGRGVARSRGRARM
jgi:hypothetical protein